MHGVSFKRRTLLKAAGTMAMASAFAPLARLAPASGMVMLVEPGNPLSRQFSALGRSALDLSVHDMAALKRLFAHSLAQETAVAGLSSWATFLLVREIALDAGRKLAFEARHDVIGTRLHNRPRLGNAASFKERLFGARLLPTDARASLRDALFARSSGRLDTPARDGALFSWLLLDHSKHPTAPSPQHPIATLAALPTLTGMTTMTLSADDRFEIQDLLSAYSWALDTGDAEAFVGCFTPTAVVREEVFEEADTWEGHAGIRALALHFMGSPRFPGRQHHVTMPQFFPRDANHVDSRSFAFVTECQAEPPMVLLFTGYYEDEIVRHQGRWRFARRTIRLWDGDILKNFPNKGEYVPRKRPADLVVKRRSIP